MTQTYHIPLPPERVRDVFRDRYTTAELLRIVRVRNDTKPFRMAYNCAKQVLVERQEEMA